MIFAFESPCSLCSWILTFPVFSKLWASDNVISRNGIICYPTDSQSETFCRWKELLRSLMIPVIVAWTAVASPLFWRHIFLQFISCFKMFSEFSWWFYGVVIVWMRLLEIARPGGLAGRFRSHGDRNWNSRGRSSCDSKTWNEKGTKNAQSFVGIAHSQWMRWNLERKSWKIVRIFPFSMALLWTCQGLKSMYHDKPCFSKSSRCFCLGSELGRIHQVHVRFGRG